jgi:hypothetical protein
VEGVEDLSAVVALEQEILEDREVAEHTILNPEEQETLHQHHLHKEIMVEMEMLQVTQAVVVAAVVAREVLVEMQQMLPRLPAPEVLDLLFLSLVSQHIMVAAEEEEDQVDHQEQVV